VCSDVKVERGMDAATVSALCDGGRFAPAPLTEAEHSALTSRSMRIAPAPVAGISRMLTLFRRVFGEDRAAKRRDGEPGAA